MDTDCWPRRCSRAFRSFPRSAGCRRTSGPPPSTPAESADPDRDAERRDTAPLKRTVALLDQFSVDLEIAAPHLAPERSEGRDTPMGRHVRRERRGRPHAVGAGQGEADLQADEMPRQDAVGGPWRAAVVLDLELEEA